MKQNINAVQTQTTTDNSTATVDVTESKTKLVDVPTQSQAFIRSVAKNFGYDIKLMSYKKNYYSKLQNSGIIEDVIHTYQLRTL